MAFLSETICAQQRPEVGPSIYRQERLPAIHSSRRVGHVTEEPTTSLPTFPKPEPVPTGPLGPPQSQQLTLVELEQDALALHPSLAQASALVEAARGKWVQVGLLPNPYFGYSGQQLGSRGLAEQDGVIFGQDFIRGGKLRLNREIACQEILKAEQELYGVQLRVLTDVRINFYDVLIAQQRRDLNDELVRVGEQASKIANDLFQAKEVSRVDVLQAKLEVEQARILQQNSRNRYSAAWRMLVAAVGDQHRSPQPLHGELNRFEFNYEWEETLARLLGTSPEIGAASAEVERARAAVARARAEAVSNVSVQAIVQHDNSIRSSDGAVQVTMPFPIFNRNQGGIRQAEGEFIAAENGLRRLELDLQQRLASVFERYANASQQVAKYRSDILPNATESLELTRAGYQAGEFNFLSLLTAQRTYFQTNLGYVEALRELWASAMEIEGQLSRPVVAP